MKDKIIKYYEQTIRDIESQLKMGWGETLDNELLSLKDEIEFKLSVIRGRQ